MWFKKYMRCNEAGDNDAGGGAGGSGEQEAGGESDSSEDATSSQEDGDKEFDDFGYEIVKTPEATQDKGAKTDDESKQDETPAKQEEKSEDVIGYEKEPEEVKKEEKKEEETKQEEKKEEKKDGEASEINFGKLADGDKKVLGEFFKAQGFTKAQAEALVQLREKEMEEFEKAKSDYEKKIEQEKLTIRKQWHDELKNDKVFGKEFEKNLSKVNKVVTSAFPNLKNKLTESKTMLPPYLVRDLLAVHNLLYKTEGFTQGDPEKGDESSSEGSGKYDFLNEFYK